VPAPSLETRAARPRRAHHAGDGWASKRNGELLRLAEREFDVFLTVDGKLPNQQNLAAFNIAVVVLLAPSNTLEDLQPLMARVLESLAKAKRGEAMLVGSKNDSR
jgi:hypothetical protein